MGGDLEVRETPESSMPQYYRPVVEKERCEYQDQSGLNNSGPLPEPKQTEGDDRKSRSARIGSIWLVVITACVTTILVAAAVGGGLASKMIHDRDNARKWSVSQRFSIAE